MTEEVASASAGPIGEDGGTLRVLNFAGGGFDTVMQLGVTHALLVNHGRPPDIVIGVSAGAIQAAALAEVLRAGVLPDGAIDDRVYGTVLGKRVEKFRRFFEACNNAPQLVFDTVLPDAYQIDSFEPLATMRLPRLPRRERDERDTWIARKTGLVRLYNDLLSIDLPFGAAARILRRYLGFNAANSVSNRRRRTIIRLLEGARLWLVSGTELRRLAPILPLLVKPLVGMGKGVHHSTAGSIILKFRPVEGFWRFLQWLWSFSLVLNVWVVGSWIVVMLPFWLVGITDWFIDADISRSGYLYVFFFVYLLPIVLPLTPFALAYDKNRPYSAIRDLSKGMFAFAYYFLKWTGVLILMFIATVGVLQVLLFLASFAGIPVIGRGPLERGDVDVVFYLLVGITLFLVIVRPLFWIAAASISYRRARKKHNLSLGEWYARRFLDSYGIGSALAENYGLKQLLMDLFDPTYYGTAAIEPMLSASLSDAETSGFDPEVDGTGKPFSSYAKPRCRRDHRIIVAATAADIATGKMVVLTGDKPVVDSLLAATAITPILPAINIDDKYLIDAVEVGNNPTKALVELFQTHGLADVCDVHIYPVEPLPISRPELGPYPPMEGKPFVDLLDIGVRALQLQRFRDATIDRILTQIVSDTLPRDAGTVSIEQDGKSRTFFRAAFQPIELDRAPRLNRTVMFGDKAERRSAIGRTVADGCRASLEVMHSQVISELVAKEEKARKQKGDVREVKYLRCMDVIREVASRRASSADATRLPGSNDDAPGLAEVCRHCMICNPNSSPGDPPQAVRSLSVARSAKRGKASTDTQSTPSIRIPDWPNELEKDSTTRPPKPLTTEKGSPTGLESKNPDEDLPSIACLFSGGVFRGVFQLGALNALSLLNARPKIVAGASVGSITAAMVASALSQRDTDARKKAVATLASVYIGIDRIILTDRFADFIRNWTIRASETKFSLRQMDRVFRKYDEGRGKIFQLDVRQVLGGLERLFYISPYQVNTIVRSIRNREGLVATAQLKSNVQQWLDRMDVGAEVLGAEPIERLIEEFVIPSDHKRDPASAPFDSIDANLTFLATVTNLTRGKLEILPGSDHDTTLIEGLLGSSAFPGVFRPRWSWDLHPGTMEDDQYIDGGVMDNLPLHSALDKMRAMADAKLLPLRSKHGPHLMLAASLEVDSRSESVVDVEEMVKFWPALRVRAGELKYNIKLDNFKRVAENIQLIHDHAEAMRTPMRVKVLPVKPRWLCSTFAFHPMLGFRRSVQVRSIAHGCAGTLIAFAGEAEHAAAWRLEKKAIPDVSSFDAALEVMRNADRKRIKKGDCWLQGGVKCPFSPPELERFGGRELDEPLKKWLAKIHTSCWEPGTHTSK